MITLLISLLLVGDTTPIKITASKEALRVGTDSSFVTLNGNFRQYYDPYDSSVPVTITPTVWAKGKNIAGLRIRHPNSVTGVRPNLPTTILQDFNIVPYQYGMAIEYNGVVECWVGEWSIHRGNLYADIEGQGNGWGGVLWVGDDEDLGGIRATARTHGNILYSEISSEKFAGEAHGELRFRLPDTVNTFQFVYGKRGSTNVVAEIGTDGILLPRGILPINPKKGTIFFDDTDNKFKGFDGTEWKVLSN